MKTLMSRGLAAALLATSAFVAAPALAEEEAVAVEGNIAFVSDYRFRGVSFTDKNFAVQGGFDASSGGFYAGTWASSLSGASGAGSELDLYAGYGFSAGDLEFDVGALAYLFPGSNAADALEVYGSVTAPVGPGSVTAGIAYLPPQGNLEDYSGIETVSDDGYYVYLAGEADFDTSVTFSASIGYESGAFAEAAGEEEKLDYSVGASWPLESGVDIGITFIGTDVDSESTEETVVLSISKAL